MTAWCWCAGGASRPEGGGLCSGGLRELRHLYVGDNGLSGGLPACLQEYEVADLRQNAFRSSVLSLATRCGAPDITS